ncbi:Hypothetical predicted protein [Cloeon dipterum]|uniref:Uncharacterized protein n=1 Tax=Cloeon dipterum TaxID=197152 RepID=A0A8S1D382_9INSE|nr:Hypothetical predicted protein [Cloeon dipterum]
MNCSSVHVFITDHDRLVFSSEPQRSRQPHGPQPQYSSHQPYLQHEGADRATFSFSASNSFSAGGHSGNFGQSASFGPDGASLSSSHSNGFAAGGHSAANAGSQTATCNKNGGASLSASNAGAFAGNGYSATNAGSQTATFGSNGSSSLSASHSGANSNNGQSAANAGSQTATFGANGSSQFKNSLFNLALNSVVENIDSYDRDLVNSILGPIRRNVLQETLTIIKDHSHQDDYSKNDRIDKLWAILPIFYTSKNYVRFDTTDLMEIASNCFCLEDSRFKELVRCCCSNTPNLRSLTINGLDRFGLEEREWASIIALKNLEVLCLVDVSVSFPGVLAITQQCEKLEKFKANSVIVHEPSSEAFRKDFVYVNITAKSFREYELTMQKTMPKYVEKLANCAAFPQYTLLNIEPEEFADFDLVPGLTQVTDLRFSSFQLDEINEKDEFPIFPLLSIVRISVASHEHHLLKQYLNSNNTLALRKLILEGVKLSKFTLAEFTHRGIAPIEDIQMALGFSVVLFDSRPTLLGEL